MGLRVLRVIWVVHKLLWHIRTADQKLLCCKQFNKYCKQSKNISEMGTLVLWISRSMIDFDLLLIYRVIYNLYSISSKEFRLWKRKSQSEASEFCVQPMREQRVYLNQEINLILRKIQKCAVWISRSRLGVSNTKVPSSEPAT